MVQPGTGNKILEYMNSRLFLLCGFTFIFLFCRCNDDDPHPSDNWQRTIMVYLGRDNKEFQYADEDKINAMIQGWNGQGGNLVIYEDVYNGETRLMEVYHEKGENKIRILETYEPENSANPEVFKRVIRDMKSRYPADSYGLIFFSHGTGWLPEGTFTKAIGRDNGQEMDIIDFAGAIPDGLFDFMILEACFTTGIEFVYELKDKTGYILGSAAEILSPGFRETYRTSMDLLFSQEADLTGFAKNVMNWTNSQSGAYRSGTISLIQTNRLDNLAMWLKANISETFDGNIATLQCFDRGYNLFFDFEDYFSRLVTENKQAELSNLINDCILYKDATDNFMPGYNYKGFTITKHSGFTTYVMQDRRASLNEAYKNLKWYKAVF